LNKSSIQEGRRLFAEAHLARGRAMRSIALDDLFDELDDAAADPGIFDAHKRLG
jgi:hypothetical protein